LRVKTAVLLDLDGTLVDAFGDIAAAVNAPLAARGMAAHSLDAVRRMVGAGIVELCRRAAPSLSGDEFEMYLADVRAEYARHPVVHAYVYPGVLGMLERLAPLGPLAVLSNKPHSATVEVCRLLGIEPLVDIVQGEDPPGFPRKPDPTGARRVLAALGADGAIVLGDMAQDGELARGLGAPFVAALWSGADSGELAPLQPVALCRTPAEAFHAIARSIAPANIDQEGSHTP